MSKRKSKLLTKPWITQGLLKSIKTKSKLYNTLLRNPSSLNHVQYKQYRNKINHLLKISKCNYYDCKIESTKNNLKAVWKLLNTIINRRKIKSPIAKLFKDGQQEIKHPGLIAHKFCEYFTNLGPTLAKKIPNSTFSYRGFLGNQILESCFLNPVSTVEIKRLATSFNLKLGKLVVLTILTCLILNPMSKFYLPHFAS